MVYAFKYIKYVDLKVKNERKKIHEHKNEKYVYKYIF